MGAKRYLTGEATPYYLFHPHAAGRLAELIPHAKLIVLLRDPVTRALSHYQHNLAMRCESLSFEEAIQAEPERLAGELEKMMNDPAYYSYNHQQYSYLARGYMLISWHIAAIFSSGAVPDSEKSRFCPVNAGHPGASL